MRTTWCTVFLLFISAGLCWGQMPLTEIYFDNFRMVPGFGDPTILADFELGTGNWWDPDGSGSTYGTYYGPGEAYNTNSTVFVKDSLTVYDGLYSARLAYQWEHPDSAGMIREYPGSGDPQTYKFTTMDKLEVWIYGNSSGDLFRFCIDDSDGHEVSVWMPIDWDGWQLVSWDLASDSVEAWVLGNGVLDGPQVDFDSFQILKATATRVEPQSRGPQVPETYWLSQNFPNPFNAETQIEFSIGQAGHVTLKVFNAAGQLVRTLVNEQQTAGSHRVLWDGTDEGGQSVASGVYFCRLEAGDYRHSVKMTLLR